MSNHVVIRIPASTRYVALVRATASTLAALLDFTYDRITDLHIAIDEVCSRIIATSDPTPARLEITFGIEDGALMVTACGDRPVKAGAEFLTTWSHAILGSVTDEMEIADTDGIACVRFRLGVG